MVVQSGCHSTMEAHVPHAAIAHVWRQQVTSSMLRVCECLGMEVGNSHGREKPHSPKNFGMKGLRDSGARW